MSTQFFERQEIQRSQTRWLVFAFIAAITLVIIVMNLIVMLATEMSPIYIWRHHPAVIFWTTTLIAGVILGATWNKASDLRSGGAVVARSLGGVPVVPGETDFARKRLLNIVEEMAIAARIRKPQVFVLPEETAINAFAAGHSPDEAAVAVTQGALDKLDRDQLQAIIGHEFSHILNGDMQINMRLTAWIFGLSVITDLARRLLDRGERARGKDSGRIKIAVFGIFIAGCVGMFVGRLLQAAVSRRREHLADASAVQFTRNPQALQQVFVSLAANAGGSQLQHSAAADVSHMFFAGSPPSWAAKFGGGWFATHPPLEERVRALDGRVTPLKFRMLVSDERRKISARAAATPDGTAENSRSDSPAPHAVAEVPGAGVAAMAPLSSNPGELALMTQEVEAPLGETMPTGVRMVAGKALPPDILRNRLGTEQQNAISAFIDQVEHNPVAVQAAFVAAMLASEPAKWRPQLVKLAPLLGVELMKETQAQVARVAALPPASRVAAFTDVLGLLDSAEPAHRKRLRAIARAFAPTVATGDMLRFAVTRILERRLAKAQEDPPPVPLPERAAAVCTLYSALAHCRFGIGKQGQNSYRAGVMGMVPPKQWAPYPELMPTPAELDQALAGIREIHPTGRRSVSEGMARVIAVGGRLTVPQVDLLRAACLVVDCAVPVLPVDVVYEDYVAPAQANAR